MTIGTRVVRHRYGPSKPRSPAQQRAGSVWVRSGMPSAREWLAAQPKLPPGWSMRGGRLSPPKDWVWEDGKLREPTPKEIAARAIFSEQQVLFTRKKRHRLNHEITLLERSWPDDSGNGETAEWEAIKVWIGDPENMRGVSGKLSKFSYRKHARKVVVQFSQKNVALAFFLAFAKPSEATS